MRNLDFFLSLEGSKSSSHFSCADDSSRTLSLSFDMKLGHFELSNFLFFSFKTAENFESRISSLSLALETTSSYFFRETSTKDFKFMFSLSISLEREIDSDRLAMTEHANSQSVSSASHEGRRQNEPKIILIPFLISLDHMKFRYDPSSFKAK
uniref:SJCHGC09810 protein n=1 Tax=Schistosoma japonicum TaxID=6182 RepID=Q5BQU1_SCHJA|nr:SJCHGC09810 protein [Schistosoma japonicum]